MIEVRDTIIGKIAVDWKLGEFSKDINIQGRIGWKGYKTTDLVDHGPIVVGGTEIKSFIELNLSNVKHLSREKYEESPEIMLKDKDILLVTRGNLGEVGFYHAKYGEGTINPSVIILNKFKGDPKFLFYYLISKQGNHQVLSLTSGSSIPAIYQSEVKTLLYPKPPIEEQKAIAKVLTAFDDKIELLQAQNKTLETMAQTIFKEWFGKYQVGDKLPEGWRVGKLGNEFDITIGRTPPRKETQWFSDRPTGKKWISIKDIGNCGTFIYNTSEYLTDEAIEKFNIPIIPTNTTILSFKMTVGKLTITTEDMLSNEAIAHLKIKNDSTLTSEFIYLFLRDLNFNSLGSTSSIVTAINSTIIKGIDFIIPKDELMNRFQKKILPIFKKIQNNSSQIQSLTKTRDTLLPKLMSGQVRVNNIKKTADA